MGNKQKVVAQRNVLVCFALLWAIIGIRSQSLAQQTTNPGSPVVANSATGAQAFSNAYIDASASSLNTGDICVTLTNALQQLSNGLSGSYAGGAAVIDARGVTPTTKNPNTYACGSTSNRLNPWSTLTVPATVLLPAGTIQSNNTWTLPAGTKLIGQGGEDQNQSPGVSRTIIQAQANFCPTGKTCTDPDRPVLQMGTGSGCTGVSIEDLEIDGGPANGDVNGIDNPYCTDQSYVRNVTIYRIKDIGLNVYNSNDPSSFSATNSGPYSNITFDPATMSTSDAVGAYLNYTTRGIQGMTCKDSNSSSSSSGTCISINAPGNSIQDVRVEGFTNGIDIEASNTVVMNVDGDMDPTTGGSSGSVINVVKIGLNSSSNITDVALIGIANDCSGTTCNDSNDDTIEDNLTGTSLLVSKDPYVAMYVLGDKVGTTNFYSRYTTSPNAPNWQVGFGAPSSANNACAPGSLYSNMSGSGSVLYVCSATNSKWAAVQ